MPQNFYLAIWFLEDYTKMCFRFTMVAVVNGCPYTRVRASSKRDCRTGAAYFAWKNIVQQEQAKASLNYKIAIFALSIFFVA
jgi:hypothetical protein